jgi:hypothetical protein
MRTHSFRALTSVFGFLMGIEMALFRETYARPPRQGLLRSASPNLGRRCPSFRQRTARRQSMLSQSRRPCEVLLIDSPVVAYQLWGMLRRHLRCKDCGARGWGVFVWKTSRPSEIRRMQMNSLRVMLVNVRIHQTDHQPIRSVTSVRFRPKRPSSLQDLAP